jgi:hypothetical protein
VTNRERACCIPGCAEEGIVLVEDGKWMCQVHTIERVYSPDNWAMTEESADLDDFIDGGGKVS